MNEQTIYTNTDYVTGNTLLDVWNGTIGDLEMTIEFADPGYNWAFVWIPLGVFCLFLIGFVVLGILMDWDETDPFLAVAGTLMFISLLATVLVPTLFGVTEYSNKVRNMQIQELTRQGFTEAWLTGDRFTASTEDGQYFRGVLVDLQPESGYAYEVLELTGTEN